MMNGIGENYINNKKIINGTNKLLNLSNNKILKSIYKLKLKQRIFRTLLNIIFTLLNDKYLANR